MVPTCRLGRPRSTTKPSKHPIQKKEALSSENRACSCSGKRSNTGASETRIPAIIKQNWGNLVPDGWYLFQRAPIATSFRYEDKRLLAADSNKSGSEERDGLSDDPRGTEWPSPHKTGISLWIPLVRYRSKESCLEGCDNLSRRSGIPALPPASVPSPANPLVLARCGRVTIANDLRLSSDCDTREKGRNRISFKPRFVTSKRKRGPKPSLSFGARGNLLYMKSTAYQCSCPVHCTRGHLRHDHGTSLRHPYQDGLGH